jgi:hypothetical protein
MTVRISDTTWLDTTAQADLIRRDEVSPAELTQAAIAQGRRAGRVACAS